MTSCSPRSLIPKTTCSAPFLALTMAMALPGWCPSAAAAQDAPATGDRLASLLPADIGAVLAIDSLRDSSRTIMSSQLASRFLDLPPVQTWLTSPDFQKLKQARAEIEKAFNTPLTTIRDDLLGDSVLLAIRSGPDANPEQARGLLLTQVRDTRLLRKLIATLNAAEIAEGSLKAVLDRTHLDVPYSVRSFRDGAKPQEAYTLLDSGAFAWSNDESLIHQVIQLHLADDKDQSLAQNPDWLALNQNRPDHSLARLYLSAPFLAAMASTANPNPDPSNPASTLARQYFKSLKAFGACLVYRQGLILHTRELLDPTRLPDTLAEPLKRWAKHQTPHPSDSLLQEVPASAPIVLKAHIAYPALADLLLSLVPPDHTNRAQTILTFLKGILLGKDPQKEILPALGPETIAYMQPLPPGASVSPDRFPLSPVLVTTINSAENSHPQVPQAVENAMRTLFAAVALNGTSSATASQFRMEDWRHPLLHGSALLGSSPTFAYGLSNNLLAFGENSEALALFGSQPRHPFRLSHVRSAYFPEATSFLFLDIPIFLDLCRHHRPALDRLLKVQDQTAKRDLDQTLSLLGLFDSAFLTQTISADLTSVSRALGFLAPELPASPAP